MPSLLIVVFVLQVVTHLVNTLGAQAINDLLWTLYGKIPSSHASAMRSQAALRRDVVRLKCEMNATSSQDEFAKWAKLRRQHDRALALYEETTSSLKSFRATFSSVVNTLRWVGTNGLRFLLQYWFTRMPMFWLPRGWLPWGVEWVLSFPRAPGGSVSVQVWWVACATVVQLVGEAVGAGRVLMREEGEGKEGIKMGAGGEGKKEL